MKGKSRVILAIRREMDRVQRLGQSTYGWTQLLIKVSESNLDDTDYKMIMEVMCDGKRD